MLVEDEGSATVWHCNSEGLFSGMLLVEANQIL